MPTYSYEAADRTGRKLSDTIEAADEGAVKQQLSSLGLVPLSISLVGDAPRQALPSLGGISRVNNKDLLSFTIELGNLLESGMPIDQALFVLSQHSQKEAMRKILREVYMDIQRGQHLSQALSKHPEFSRLYVNMIKAGEAGGILDAVVKRLAAFLESSVAFQEELTSALVYPVILSVVGSLAVVFIILFVVPRFAVMFQDMGQALPAPTQFLLDLSAFVSSYWWLMLAGLVMGWALFTTYIKTAEGRAFWDAVKLRVPLVKDLHMKALIARFTRTLGTLLQSGVPILEAIRIAKDVVGNDTVTARLAVLEDGVRRGRGVAGPLKECGVFPSLVVQMIAVGEEAGRLEQTFITVAERFEGESSTLIKRVMSLVAPVMILLMSLVVGFIVVSMLLAVFSINEIPV